MTITEIQQIAHPELAGSDLDLVPVETIAGETEEHGAATAESAELSRDEVAWMRHEVRLLMAIVTPVFCAFSLAVALFALSGHGSATRPAGLNIDGFATGLALMDVGVAMTVGFFAMTRTQRAAWWPGRESRPGSNLWMAARSVWPGCALMGLVGLITMVLAVG